MTTYYDPYGAPLPSTFVPAPEQSFLDNTLSNWTFPPNHSDPDNFIGHIFRLGMIDFRDRTTFDYNQGPADINPTTSNVTGRGSVFLPFPDNIQVAYAPTWDFVELETYRPLMQKFRSAAGTVSDTLSKGIVGAYQSTIQGFQETYDALSKLSLSEIIDTLSPAAIYAIQRATTIAGLTDEAAVAQLATRKVYNPYKEALFRGVANRGFNFSWTFYPRNVDECKVLQSILKVVRYHALPSLPEDTLLFSFPGEFTLDFFKRDNPQAAQSAANLQGQPITAFQDMFAINENIPRIGYCVCTGLDTNLTSNGVWAALENGHPVDIQLAMQFTEVEIVTKEKVLAGY